MRFHEAMGVKMKASMLRFFARELIKLRILVSALPNSWNSSAVWGRTQVQIE
jgi:hypothetical protein